MDEKESMQNADDQDLEETAAPPETDEAETIDSAEADGSDEAAESEEEETTDQTQAPAKEKSGKSSFFKKKEKKKDERDEKIAELNDRVMRNMAEFDNFRKRTEKEKSQMFEIGAKSIVEKILPVIDNFERGLGALSEEEKQGAFAVGMEKVYKQLLTSLEEAGVKPIEAVGQEFDPNFHNAVMHIEDEELGENIVAEEFQKGYLYHESVVRHSMVKVAN